VTKVYNNGNIFVLVKYPLFCLFKKQPKMTKPYCKPTQVN